MSVVMLQDRRGSTTGATLGWRTARPTVVEAQEMSTGCCGPSPPVPRARSRQARWRLRRDERALSNPLRFAVVESWLGYFNHLGDELEADRSVIRRLGLRRSCTAP